MLGAPWPAPSPSAEWSPGLTNRQPSQLQWSLGEVGEGARAAKHHHSGQGRDAPARSP